jgi:UDP-N-acetylglucosamine--N-acetylmuramyl-(pentapeptide) pyrophosphoryl-undecaprenol N-acetylglucosamine transferase
MHTFFPAANIIKTGNPVRKTVIEIEGKKEEAASFFELETSKKTILVVGGSLGSRTLNNSMVAGLKQLESNNIQLIWQTGKHYYKSIADNYADMPKSNGIRIYEFLNRMDLAFAMADVIISRAGAGTIAELCLINKPVILVPSPNVAEDHQTKNAEALVQENAAILIKDEHAEADLVDQTIKLLKDPKKIETLSIQIAKLGIANSDEQIALEILKLA